MDADEEDPVRPPPLREVSVRDNVVNETSSLLGDGASTLTPSVRDCSADDPRRGGRRPWSGILCGDSRAASSGSRAGSGSHRRTVRGAVLVAIICSSALFGADLINGWSSSPGRTAMHAPVVRRSERCCGDGGDGGEGKGGLAKAAKVSKPGKAAKGSAEEPVVVPDPNTGQNPGQIEYMEGIIEDVDVDVPSAHRRCEYVTDTFELQNADAHDKAKLKRKYAAQSADVNVFYRATALLMWQDFARGLWGEEQGKSVDFDDLVSLKNAIYEDGSAMSPKSTWTWITGDQHLSNFGAWRNRGGEIVFGVNDFDEAAIYDFQLDVIRIAVSIVNHGKSNGLKDDEIESALEALTYTYVKTTIDYVGGDEALTYELTPYTSTGVLRDFLFDVANRKSSKKQLRKFTEVKDGVRRFSYGEESRLENVPADLEQRIRDHFTAEKYGTTMMKMGFRVRGWDDDFFSVLDVGRRVGSGIGSFGVDRFYVLLKGDGAVSSEGDDGAIILDVKFEPTSAVTRSLNEEDSLWYDELFRNEADRTVRAQRMLTSYTDPYLGYIVLDGRPFGVRERSPYKNSFDLSTLKDHRVFNEFVEQIAVATATAHTRGTVSKSPGQFKHVIKVLLAGERNRRRWSDLISKIALEYSKQVQLDFECFEEYVREKKYTAALESSS